MPESIATTVDKAVTPAVASLRSRLNHPDPAARLKARHELVTALADQLEQARGSYYEAIVDANLGPTALAKLTGVSKQWALMLGKKAKTAGDARRVAAQRDAYRAAKEAQADG